MHHSRQAVKLSYRVSTGLPPARLDEDMIPYKTILVHVGPPFGENCALLAAGFARDFGAHLVGVAFTGLDLLLAPGIVETGNQAIAEHVLGKVESADLALERFEAAVRDAGVASFESCRFNGDAEAGIAAQIKYSDLAIVAQGLEGSRVGTGWKTLPESLLRHATRPVLVVPDRFAKPSCGQHAVIAWDDSAAAARAVFCAIPMLQRAGVIEAVACSTDDGLNTPSEMESLARYLSRHGVAAKLSFLHTRRNSEVGLTLSRHVEEVGADLLVMGAYGHSRCRELVMGSVSKVVISGMTVPVLFSH